jgi:hypothetical protein
MRTLIVKIMLLPISLLAACSSKNQQAKEFIPGTYVNRTQSEYSIAYDTLQVLPDAMTENFYHIKRKTAFRRILNGKLQQNEQETRSLTGLWDERKQILQLSENGVILIFQPGGSQLMIGNNIYRKL